MVRYRGTEASEEMSVTSGRFQDALGIPDPSLNTEKALQRWGRSWTVQAE